MLDVTLLLILSLMVILLKFNDQYLSNGEKQRPTFQF